MKKLITILLLFFGFTSFAQYDSTRNLDTIDQYGFSWKNGAFRYSLRIPKDTPRIARKDSGCIAFKNSTIYTWTGYYWKAVATAGSGGVGVNIYNSDGTLTESRTIETDGHDLYITNTATPTSRIKLDNGTGYIDMQGEADKIGFYNGHTLMELGDGLTIRMANTGTAYFKTNLITNGQTRNLELPDKAGTVALLSDVPDTASLSDRIDQKVDSTTKVQVGCISYQKYWINGTSYNVDTVIKPSGRIAGGFVTRINDTTFSISACTYTLECITYNSPTTTVTLPGNSDNSTGRFVVIGVDNTSNVFSTLGANSSNPSVPQVNEQTQLPRYTVFFPPLSDSGIVNIYNITNSNGVDSAALYTVSQPNDSTIIICSLSGRCDTIVGNRFIGVDSLRRQPGSTTVQGRKNGVWLDQFVDSVGTGGSGGDTLNATINPWVNNKKFFRHMAGVIRATASGNNQPITWAFLDTTTSHTHLAFDSVKGQGNEIKLFYPKVKNVNALVVTPDETLAGAGVICGSSVGDSVSSVLAYTTTLNCGQLTGNTSSWTNGSVSLSGLSYSTSTGLTIFSPTTGGTGTIYASSPEVLGAQITYVGSGNKRVRRAYSGLSGQTIGFYLVDSANVIITGNLASTDIVAISIPRTRVVPLPAQTTSPNGFPSDIYTSTANFWIIASMEVFMIGYPLPGTGRVKLEWQTAKTGSSNYATSYRITRAAMATPNTETDIFSGFGFEVVDSGLTANTGYIYRMYATILGTERLITNEKVYTNP